MANIELVIKMPEDVFKRTMFYREFRDLNDCVTTIKALEKAVPLLKGHGDLIDVNEITAFRELECNGHDVESLDEFTTIIEADTESEDKK